MNPFWLAYFSHGLKPPTRLCQLTWNLRIHPWKRKIIVQTIMFRFYVNLRGCMQILTFLIQSSFINIQLSIEQTYFSGLSQTIGKLKSFTNINEKTCPIKFGPWWGKLWWLTSPFFRRNVAFPWPKTCWNPIGWKTTNRIIEQLLEAYEKWKDEDNNHIALLHHL